MKPISVSGTLNTYVCEYDDGSFAHPLCFDLLFTVSVEDSTYLFTVHILELDIEARIDHVYVGDF